MLTLTPTSPSEIRLERPFPPVAGVEHRFVEVRGLRVHVAEAGQGEPLVMLHGWPQHWYEWRFQIPVLAQHYRVICPDLRGFGWTDAPASGYDKETLAGDIIALLDALGLEQVRFMGHDWGGWIGFLIGLRQPDRIRRHLALNIAPIWPKVDWRVPIASARFGYMFKIAAPLYGAWLVQHRPGFVHHLLTRTATRAEGWPAAELHAFSDQFQNPARARASVHLYRTFLAQEFFPVLFGRYHTQRLKTPTLLLFGAKDFAIATSWLRGYEPYVDDFKIELVEGVGHFIADEQPDLVNQRALAFFGAP